MSPDTTRQAHNLAGPHIALVVNSSCCTAANLGSSQAQAAPPLTTLASDGAAAARITQIRPETLWRAPELAVVLKNLGDPAFVSALVETVERVRPAAIALANALDSREPAALLGEAVLIERRLPLPVESLATDLLASSLLLEGAAGDPTARVAVEYLRRRRQLEPPCWISVAVALHLSVTDGASAVSLRG